MKMLFYIKRMAKIGLHQRIQGSEIHIKDCL